MIEMELIRFIPVGVDQEAQEGGLTLAIASKVCQRRLPLLLASVRSMVAMMIPDGDISELEANWDAVHIMQEIHGSVLDFLAKAKWLGSLLKKHCAPCRDKDIDRMIQTISAGDIASIASGLIELLRVIELMRLDISNYQIRSLRPYFIDSSLQFQQRFYASQIVRHKFDPFKSRTWFVQCRQELEKTPTAAPELLALPSNNINLKAFINGFIQLVLPSCRTPIPATFERDAVRMQAIRSELLGRVQLIICYKLFVEFLKREHANSGRLAVLPLRDRTAVRANLHTISHKDGGTIAALPNLAVEIVRQIAAVGTALPGQPPRPMDLGLLQEVEKELEHRLNPNNCAFERVEREVHRRLTADVFGVAEGFLHTLPFEIFTSLVPGARPPPHGCAATLRQSVGAASASPVAAAAAAAARRKLRHGKRPPPPARRARPSSRRRRRRRPTGSTPCATASRTSPSCTGACGPTSCTSTAGSTAPRTGGAPSRTPTPTTAAAGARAADAAAVRPVREAAAAARAPHARRGAGGPSAAAAAMAARHQQMAVDEYGDADDEDEGDDEGPDPAAGAGRPPYAAHCRPQWGGRGRRRRSTAESSAGPHSSPQREVENLISLDTDTEKKPENTNL